MEEEGASQEQAPPKIFAINGENDGLCRSQVLPPLIGGLSPQSAES